MRHGFPWLRSGHLWFGLVLLTAACGPQPVDHNALAQTRAILGGMREDFAPADASFTNADLAVNAERIIFFRENREIDGRTVRGSFPAELTRWEDPVFITMISSDSLTDAQVAADRSAVGTFVTRLSDITGHPITLMTPTDEIAEETNVLLMFMDASERREFADGLVAREFENMRLLVRHLRGEDRFSPCYVVPYTRGDDDRATTFAIVVIKNEVEGLLRRACIHEELAQLLGPGNDDPRVRPSIFNDDQEFALLTEHDEYILRILYDDALRPGMTLEEARPLIPGIVERIRPEGRGGS